MQHNPSVSTVSEPFISLLSTSKEQGTYAENIQMFQDGNYLLISDIWRNTKTFGTDKMVAFDIIRVDENGEVGEHLDVIREILTEGMAHHNDMIEFSC